MLRSLTAVLTLGYFAALVTVALALRFIGERWWLTTFTLYLPRVGLGIPLPALTVLLLVFGPRRLLLGVPFAVAFLVFVLMGFHLGIGNPRPATAGDLSLRVLTCNVLQGRSPQAIADIVRNANPDLVLMQEFAGPLLDPLAAALPGFHTHRSEEFFLASRHPVREVQLPLALYVDEGYSVTPGYVRYAIDTTKGIIDVFNLHADSPRRGLHGVRDAGIRGALRRYPEFYERGPATIAANADVRRRQVAALSAAATGSTRPVIIAGDTNLPGLSWIFATYLRAFQDGFAEAGRGFGYTFPAHHPWLRLDRILVDARLSLQRFEMVASQASDHFCVWADVSPR